VPGRGAELVDVAVDAVGMSVGLIVIWRWVGLRREGGRKGEKEEDEESRRGGARIAGAEAAAFDSGDRRKYNSRQ